MDLTPYHAKYFAYELTKRSPSDSVQKLVTSLMDAQVDLNPHQVEAALFAFRSPLSSGAILADEVGLGKTIEAGLVISQKWAERKRKILVITPANLRKQWSQELSDKFFIPSVILEAKSFNEQIHKGNFNPFVQANEVIICSYQFARRQEAYVKSISWDLVVIDEAHRLRNVYKQSNKIANSIKTSVADRPKILLTATPLQNSLLELYGLVSFIDDFAFGDLDSFRNKFLRTNGNGNFEELKNRLKPICIRTLRKQVQEYVKYTKRIPITQEFYPTKEEQELYDLVSTYLQSETLYALPKSQRQLMTLILRRLLASSTYAISGTLESLVNRLDTIITEHKEDGAESLQNLEEDFEELDDLLDEWEEDAESELDKRKMYSAEEIAEIKIEHARLKDFHNLAKSIQRNSKGEVLLTAIMKGLAGAVKSGAQRKAIIFTESTRTQKYIFELLEKTEFKGKIVLFNGSNNDLLSKQIYEEYVSRYVGTDRLSGSKSADKRAAIIDYFKDEAEIMIATEAAAEGVNLQFCSLVVNYDLPWNPQRIEQRIGRCHRYGQQFDVVVVNFLNKVNAADQRVYKLLDEKFNLFEGVFGASDEILGAVESGVDFEKRIVDIYQKCRSQESIQESFDLLQKELEEVINETLHTTRLKLLENFDQEVIEKLRIRDNESRTYISLYQEWLMRLTRYLLTDYAEFDDDELSFRLRKNPFPEENIHPGPYMYGRCDNTFNTYRIGHPLARKIIDVCKRQETPNAILEFQYSNMPQAKIAALEDLVGQSGWLKLSQITVCGFECEDILLFAGITDQGDKLTHDQCKRLFSLQAKAQGAAAINENSINILEASNIQMKAAYLEELKAKNNQYFLTESEKISSWADDIITAAENEIKTTKNRIKDLNRLLRKSGEQLEILAINKELRELEVKKRRQRQRVFEVEDEIEKKRDELISSLENRLEYNTQEITLFTIRWRLM